MRFNPSTQAQAPLIACHQTRELPLWSRRTEVVAVLKTEFKKRCCHHRTNDVRTDIRVFGATTAVPQKTRQRIKRTGDQRLPEYITVWQWAHLNSVIRNRCPF
jgi:hypothetical protein